jgi:hypothetical protein
MGCNLTNLLGDFQPKNAIVMCPIIFFFDPDTNKTSMRILKAPVKAVTYLSGFHSVLQSLLAHLNLKSVPIDVPSIQRVCGVRQPKKSRYSAKIDIK